MNNSHGIREIVYNFQSHSGLVGPIRTEVLEKCLAAAIAYSAPCFMSEMSQGLAYYRSTVQGVAMTLISQVNELLIVRADKVLSDVELLWLARYAAINDPLECVAGRRFYSEMASGDDITSHYELWVRKFQAVMAAEWTRVNGGE